MRANNSIPIVDLFAGPGGLGEGFSSLDGYPFRIVVSAEMDPHAHATLKMRALYRALKRKGGAALSAYYDFCNNGIDFPNTPIIQACIKESQEEAQQLTLGDPKDNEKLDNIIKANKIGPTKDWVLIGGPPCQAYSLVGRARNKGKADYVAEKDHRHFLYREYLRIIQEYRPAVFVMENVKGILSSSISGEKIFHTILQDLADPDRAMEARTSLPGYRIHSLTHDVYFDKNTDFKEIDVRKFIVRAEEHGIPQARHRVILLGIREDKNIRDSHQLILNHQEDPPTVQEAIGDLPKLRSKLSKQTDSDSEWLSVVQAHFRELSIAANKRHLNDLSEILSKSIKSSQGKLRPGQLRKLKLSNEKVIDSCLHNWYYDENLKVWLNHETRGHMQSDLMRYAYAAAFAQLHQRSPKGHEEFDLLEKLKPSHANWETGKFSDRFRVQVACYPSTTITSHISKDGHYFIHYDPTQCRSLTVREAARLQTFPDNYFFQGNRTQQFHQVGNAVPPLLSRQIAEIVKNVLF
jgi:DNA (cytosine-5)-methyltransferase 1